MDIQAAHAAQLQPKMTRVCCLRVIYFCVYIIDVLGIPIKFLLEIFENPVGEQRLTTLTLNVMKDDFLVSRLPKKGVAVHKVTKNNFVKQ